MARRTINRVETRAEFEAYEASRRIKQEDDDDDDEEEEEEAEESPVGEDEGDEPEDEDEDEARPKRKKPAKVPKPRSRSRTAKVPRLKVVWGVFSNTNQCIARYEYPQKHEAEEHAARLRAEKKQTFFVQPVKEPIDEKKQS